MIPPLEKPGSIRSQIWKTLLHLLPGPPMLTVRLPESDQPIDFYGWPVLRLEALAAHQSGGDETETRIVYANWGWKQMPMPPTALLRTVYGSQQLAREAASEQSRTSEPFPVPIPVRFIWLPIDQVREWVAGFEQLLVPVGDPVSDDDESSIRTLRIDLNWISQVFEKRWQARDANHLTLNQYWEQTWTDMTRALHSELAIEEPVRVHEHSGWLQVKDLYPFRYSSDLYDPDRHSG